MNKIFTLLAMALFAFGAFAQAPERMSYQSVIRNSSGVLVSNTAVGIRVSILLGSPSGTAVYTETHNVTTNANGLASLAVGGGTVVSGTFAAIDWSAGSYYVKTETDPAGGTNYTISGTSQLLSVPYALYAAKSPSTIGNIAPGSSVGDMMYWDGAAWALVPVGDNGDVLALCDNKPKWTKGGSCKPYYIGQNFQGGIIFYIDSTGEHGLIAAENDLVIAPWGCGGTFLNITNPNLGAGVTNTADIEAACTTPGTAADLCANLNLNGYSDWYLPSIGELYYLSVNKDFVGGFNPGYHYWTSTERDADNSWDIQISRPWETLHYTNKNSTGAVRPIRSF